MSVHLVEDYAHSLIDGRWELRGAIKVWVPNPPKPVAVADLIACPMCRATITQPCRTRNGRPANHDHHVRLVSRRCPCGEVLEPHKRLCPPCRAESDKARARDYARRVRGAA